MLSNNLKGAKMVEEDISADNTLKERFLSPPLHTKTLHQIIITSRGQLLLEDMNFIEPFISLWALFFCNWTLFMCWMRLFMTPKFEQWFVCWWQPFFAVFLPSSCDFLHLSSLYILQIMANHKWISEYNFSLKNHIIGQVDKELLLVFHLHLFPNLFYEHICYWPSMFLKLLSVNFMHEIWQQLILSQRSVTDKICVWIDIRSTELKMKNMNSKKLCS